MGDALRGQREGLGLTRRQVADRSGLSYPYVSQLENGDREPSLDALSKLASALGIGAEDLLKPSTRSQEPLASAAPPHTPRPDATAPGPDRHTARWAPDETDWLEGARPAAGKWLKNPAYTPAAPSLRPAPGHTAAAALIEDAYKILLALPPADRLDAAGALLARCVRDCRGQS